MHLLPDDDQATFATHISCSLVDLIRSRALTGAESR
jgi:hypothetical protein